MAENSKIEWCDHSWNPWFGCTKVGPPCDNCYAEALMDVRLGKVTWGPGEDRVRTSAANRNLPFKWDRMAAAAGRPATVFCLSLGDIWDNEVDPLWRHQAFEKAGIYAPRHAMATNNCIRLGWVEQMLTMPDGSVIRLEDKEPGTSWEAVVWEGCSLTEEGRRALNEARNA